MEGLESCRFEDRIVGAGPLTSAVRAETPPPGRLGGRCSHDELLPAGDRSMSHSLEQDEGLRAPGQRRAESESLLDERDRIKAEIQACVNDPDFPGNQSGIRVTGYGLCPFAV